jgi:creatinine amidohydrolase
MRLEELKWPDLSALSSKIFLVPLGSLEQHGNHLPLMTDSTIISEIARRVESRRADQVVALPTQWLGHSPHHRRLGCVSLDIRPYMDMIFGICSSLTGMGARRILLLNGHGGNEVPCKAAMREIKSAFERITDLRVVYAAYWSLAAARFAEIRSSPIGGMNHACEMETSVMLALAPDLVEMEKAEAGGPYRETGLRQSDMLHARPYYVVSEFDEISPSGTAGLPQFADREKGEAFLEVAVNGVIAFLDEWPV